MRALALGSAGAKPHGPSLLPEPPKPPGRARQGLDGVPGSQEGAGSRSSRPGVVLAGKGAETNPRRAGSSSSGPGTSTVWILLQIQGRAFPPFRLTSSCRCQRDPGIAREKDGEKAGIGFWAVLAPDQRRNPRWLHLHLQQPRWGSDNPNSSVTAVLRRKGRDWSRRGRRRTLIRDNSAPEARISRWERAQPAPAPGSPPQAPNPGKTHPSPAPSRPGSSRDRALPGFSRQGSSNPGSLSLGSAGRDGLRAGIVSRCHHVPPRAPNAL